MEGLPDTLNESKIGMLMNGKINGLLGFFSFKKQHCRMYFNIYQGTHYTRNMYIKYFILRGVGVRGEGGGITNTLETD